MEEDDEAEEEEADEVDDSCSVTAAAGSSLAPGRGDDPDFSESLIQFTFANLVFCRRFY